MGAPIKVVNVVSSKAYDDEEANKFDEEIQYSANYLGVPTVTFKGKVGTNMGTKGIGIVTVIRRIETVTMIVMSLLMTGKRIN